MAKTLKEFAFQKRQVGKSLYDRYLDGKIWQITEEDFPGRSLKSVASGIITVTKRRGQRVKCSLRGGGLVVQAYKG